MAVANMTRLFAFFMTCMIVLSACGGGGGGGSSSKSGSIGGSGGGDGGGSGDDGEGGGGDDGGGGEPPFQTALRVLDVADPQATYDQLLDAQTDTFQHGVFTPVGNMQNFATFTSVVDPANIPASGTIEYVGHMFILVSNNATSSGATVVGDATLGIDVDARSFSGIANGFLGKPDDEEGNAVIVDYSGDVLIQNGTLSETGGYATVSADIDGTIDDAVNTYEIKNSLTGYLFGSGGGGFAAGHTRVATDMNSIINGNAADRDEATLRLIRQP